MVHPQSEMMLHLEYSRPQHKLVQKASKVFNWLGRAEFQDLNITADITLLLILSPSSPQLYLHTNSTVAVTALSAARNRAAALLDSLLLKLASDIPPLQEAALCETARRLVEVLEYSDRTAEIDIQSRFFPTHRHRDADK